MTPKRVTVVEVGPRDGLQNERVARADRRQDRVRQPAERRAPAGHRGVRVRQPEVGAADGRRGGRVRRHHASAGHPLHGARAEPRRARPRHRGGRHRDRGVRRVHRDLQPQEHQPEHRRLARHLRAGLRARARVGAARPRLPLDRVRLSVRGRRRPGARRRRRRAAGAISASSRSRSATPSASRIPGRSRPCSTRSWRACRSIRSRCTFTTRAEPRSPTSSRRFPTASPRSTPSAGGLGGCPYAPGAAGQPGHRRSDLHAGRAGH